MGEDDEGDLRVLSKPQDPGFEGTKKMAAFQQVPHQGSWPGFMEVGATNDQDHSMIDPLEASFIRYETI